MESHQLILTDSEIADPWLNIETTVPRAIVVESAGQTSGALDRAGIWEGIGRVPPRRGDLRGSALPVGVRVVLVAPGWLAKLERG